MASAKRPREGEEESSKMNSLWEGTSLPLETRDGPGNGGTVDGPSAERVVLTNTSDASVLAVSKMETAPIAGQKMGTSGLRKKVAEFKRANYTANVMQSILNTVPASRRLDKTLVISGDGRHYSREALQIGIKAAAANHIGRVWIGKGGLMSTPAVSAVIREREGGGAVGGIILTASHNPGGPKGDFGIKFNVGNGGPAPDWLTAAIFSETQKVTELSVAASLPDVDIDTVGVHRFENPSLHAVFEVEVIDPADDWLRCVKRCFDFDALRAFVSRSDFNFVFDGLHGVAGAYAHRLFVDELGGDASSLLNCTPSEDFGGGHPDPNLTYAPGLVAAMGLGSDGLPLPSTDKKAFPAFGAACDGDADRNMILGQQFFVTPSDSVAIIAANYEAIPYFASGIGGCARSMPTSGALDRVAEALGIPLFETPTGWKYFGNLMDSGVNGGTNYAPFLCGEESFGTGSDHIREKDGLWAVLAWLSILAHRNKDVPDGDAGFVSVEDIVREHWAKYGRNFYQRYDYEEVDADAANKLMDRLRERIAALSSGSTAGGAGGDPRSVAGLNLVRADEFAYTDPTNGDVTERQGLRFYFEDGSRLIFRLSGTGSVGATIRMYLERLETDVSKQSQSNADALAGVVAAGLELSGMAELTGRTSPSVIT